MKQFETFGEYMFDLLFAPLKKGRKTVNQLRIFFKVMGREFDDLKAAIFRVRSEANVASCSEVMLPVHGQDRDNGQHQLRIEAVDGNFATSVRVFSFSKKETVIKFELAAPEETDAAATKVLVTPTWKIEGAVAKVEACNNGFDAVPTWEDITAMVQINRVYNFTNKTKTASKWGVNIRFTITKNEGFEGEVSISGFGGAYE